MKYACTAAAILILLLIGLNLGAGEIITWTDEDGNVNITNLPPPEGIKIQNVIPYKKKPDEEIREYEHLQEQKRQDRLKQQKIQEAKKAENDAEKAKNEAEEAESRAQEAVQKANEYLNKHNPRKKKKRNAYIFRTKKLVQEAEKAKAQAVQALNKANQTEKEAKEAAKIVQDFDSQHP
jgi:AAA15 family ATPase/GTPase